MTDYELAKTFFPSTRRELLVASSPVLLMTRAGEKRIKLSLSMPFGDGKLVGMPTWIGDSYDVICRENSLLTVDKWGHEIKEMALTIFSTEDSQKPAQLASAPLLNLFSLRRDTGEEKGENLSDVNLHFVAYLSASKTLWTWLYDHFRMSIFCKFETTQKELPMGSGPEQMALEAERKDATSKERDAEFAEAAN